MNDYIYCYIFIGYSGIECHFSQLFNISILHVEYRLSPEHSLPAPVEDTIAIYRALLRQNISPSQLIFMGDSAGGGLSLLTIQSLITHQLPVPRGVIVLSPWADISASGESYTRNRHTDVMLTSDNNGWIIEQLLGPNHTELSTNSSVFSPLFGSFEGFPPMYINVGTAEILEDDARRVLQKAQEADVDVTFEEGLHMMHVYPIFFSYFPEAQITLHNINRWLQTIFS
jgi:acetyl esterase/lipase